jgi:hypothetical protein
MGKYAVLLKYIYLRKQIMGNKKQEKIDKWR